MNKKYIDSVLSNLSEYYCNKILVYPDSYKPNKARKDVHILNFLNDVINKDITLLELINNAHRLKKVKVYSIKKENGLINFYKFLLVGNYLRVDLRIECIDSIIYKKKCIVNTSTKARCGESGIRYVDFRLLSKSYLPNIDFPLAYEENVLTANRFLLDKIQQASKTHNGYKFGLEAMDNSNSQKRILINQFNYDSSCCYSYTRPHKDFRTLIEANDTLTIKTLLFSPNYFYSVNAMEAIIYLESVNKVELNQEIKERIEHLKSASFDIMIQKSDDLFFEAKGYKEIGTSDAAVIMKYKQSSGANSD